MSDTTPAPETPSTAVAEPPPAPVPAPAKSDAAATPKSTPRPAGPQSLPPYKVLLHNDDISPMDHVVRSLRQLTPVNSAQAHQIMMTAHTRGLALVLVTHKERAELYVEQFRTKKLLVTIEPS